MNLRADAGATSTMRCRDSVVNRGMSGRGRRKLKPGLTFLLGGTQ